MIIALHVSIAVIIVSLCLIMVLEVLDGIIFHQYQIIIKEMLDELDRIGEEVAKTETREELSRQRSENKFNK